MKRVFLALMLTLLTAQNSFADHWDNRRPYWGYQKPVRCDDNRGSYWDGRRPDYRDWRHNQSYLGWRRNDPGSYDDRYGFRPGDCPPGFHVNERNCTNDERRHGCMDQRSRSGQICVGWR